MKSLNSRQEIPISDCSYHSKDSRTEHSKYKKKPVKHTTLEKFEMFMKNAEKLHKKVRESDANESCNFGEDLVDESRSPSHILQKPKQEKK